MEPFPEGIFLAAIESVALKDRVEELEVDNAQLRDSLKALAWACLNGIDEEEGTCDSGAILAMAQEALDGLTRTPPQPEPPQPDETEGA